MGVGYSNSSITTIELPKNVPEYLPLAIDDCSLAFHLGFRNKILWYVLYDTTAQYRRILIPKAKGGLRVIHEPSDIMKRMSKNLLVRFFDPLQERLTPHVSAYRKGLSVKDAVTQHIRPCPICEAATPDKTPPKHNCPRCGTFIHLDLKDFFPSTTRARVRNYIKTLGYSHDVAGLIANLTIVQDIPNPKYQKKLAVTSNYKVPRFFTGVPQGAPASGAICNLTANHYLDQKIIKYLAEQDERAGLTEERKWVYTRYSDDLSFSCGISLSLEERKQIIADLSDIIYRAGYRVNKSKTRSVQGYQRRILLGMVFNQKPNIPKEIYYRFRAIVHNCATRGFETQFEKAKQPSAAAMVDWLKGKVNWFTQINENKGTKLQQVLNLAIAKYNKEIPNGC